jgi:hypothetical protein
MPLILPLTSSSARVSNSSSSDSTQQRNAGRLIDQAIAQEDLTRRSDSPIANSPGKSSAGSASVSGFRAITPVVVLNTIGKGIIGENDSGQGTSNGAGGIGNTNNGNVAGVREGAGTGVSDAVAGLLKVILPAVIPKPKARFKLIKLFTLMLT